MPTFAVRPRSEVPQPTKSPKAVQEAQRQFEDFIREIGDNVGELELLPNEQIRGMKVRLRRAATRMGLELDIWDANERVYFMKKTKRGRRKES